MLRNLLVIIFFLLSIQIRAEFIIPSFVKDQANLLSLSFTKRMDLYLDGFYQKSGVRLNVRYLQSLNGQSIDEYTAKIYGDNSEVLGVTFVLSTSDRAFNIALSPAVKEKINPEAINYISDLVIPYIQKRQYDQATLFVTGQLINNIDPSYVGVAPPASYKKFHNSKGLLFFVVVFVLMFLFGHRLRKARVIYADQRLCKKGKGHLNGSWT